MKKKFKYSVITALLLTTTLDLMAGVSNELTNCTNVTTGGFGGSTGEVVYSDCIADKSTSQKGVAVLVAGSSVSGGIMNSNINGWTFDENGKTYIGAGSIIFRIEEESCGNSWPDNTSGSVSASFKANTTFCCYFGVDNGDGTYQLGIAVQGTTGASKDDPFTNLGAKYQFLNAKPAIESVTNIQTLQDNSTITPFSDVNVSDSDGDNINITITLDSVSKGSLSGTGLTDNSDGNYTISAGSPIDVNSTLHSIIFTPTQNRVVYETKEYTKIKLTLTDANSASVTDNITIAIVGVNSAIQADTTPDDFNFSAKIDQEVLTDINSSVVTISGINVDTNISITNGYYRINGGSWTNTSGVLTENNTTSTISYTIEVNNTTSPSWYETNTTTLTIGTVSREFNTTTAKAKLSELSANKWQLKSVGNGKLADLSTSSVDSSELNSSIWAYRDNLWVQNPTNVTPKEGLWVKPTGTTINFKAKANTTNDLTDANAQYAYYKDLNKSAWHLVGVPNELEWSNVIRNSNITPNTCPFYSGFYFYDTTNSTWNTTTNIPANSGAFIKHICP